MIGANSLVRGTVPPRCLAVGFRARVVAKAPEFPREVSDAEKSGFLKEIVAEIITHLNESGFPCRQQAEVIEVEETRRRWFFRSVKLWKCIVAHDQLPPGGEVAGVDVILSLRHIPEERRTEFARRGQMWIDLEKKERSNIENELGQEVSQYLKRYGVRLLRV